MSVNYSKTISLRIETYLPSYPCWLLVYTYLYVYRDVHGYTAAQLYTHHHLLISKPGKSTSSYNAQKCIIWKRRSKWRVRPTTASARKRFLVLLEYLKPCVSLADRELCIAEKNTPGASPYCCRAADILWLLLKYCWRPPGMTQESRTDSSASWAIVVHPLSVQVLPTT